MGDEKWPFPHRDGRIRSARLRGKMSDSILPMVSPWYLRLLHRALELRLIDENANGLRPAAYAILSWDGLVGTAIQCEAARGGPP